MVWERDSQYDLARFPSSLPPCLPLSIYIYALRVSDLHVSATSHLSLELVDLYNEIGAIFFHFAQNSQLIISHMMTACYKKKRLRFGLHTCPIKSNIFTSTSKVRWRHGYTNTTLLMMMLVVFLKGVLLDFGPKRIS